MRLTAELALDQVKGNKVRTMGTVAATAFSAALLTAVMCFVTSGYRMIMDFMGELVDDYAGVYFMMLLIPAVILGLLIAFMSVTVISNIYENSASKRLGEFGVLKCVGATRKQIRETVIFESLWVSIIAIPLGLLIGTLIGYLGVQIAGGYVDDLNELSRSVVMHPVSFELGFHVSALTYLFAAVFSLTVVLISAGKPARRSGGISAIECVKGIKERSVSTKAVKDSAIMEKLFGYEGILGHKNVKRNKSGYKSTVRALALSIMLILILGSFTKQASAVVDWMGGMGDQMIVDYVSLMEDTENAKTGKTETKFIMPISYETADEITLKLRGFEDGFDVLGIGSDRETYRAISDETAMSAEFLAIPGVVDQNGEIKSEIVTVDRVNYEAICNKAGVPVGSNILINSYRYNDNGVIKTVAPFTGNSITLVDAADNRTVQTVDAVIDIGDLDAAFAGLNEDPIKLIVPTAESRGFTWYCDPEDDAAFTKFAKEIMDGYFPVYTEDSYVDQGFSVRVSRADQMVKVMNIAIVLGEVLLAGFVVLLVVMGLASVISTLSSGIRVRKKEFAVLKSIGMTRASLEKMLISESVICSIKALGYGTAAGIIIPWLMNLSIRKIFPVRYELPVVAFLIGILTVAVIVIAVTRAETSKLRKQNIIEDIRMDLM